MATFEEAGGQQVIIRSFEPATALSSDYSIDFDALDADGDGFISRSEAAANERLAEEFRGVDADGDGRLSREELRGWIR
jgi:Ca2+-binding EF-hand superfamily protein